MSSMPSWRSFPGRVAHFLVENQETGNDQQGNFLKEIAVVFLENFLGLTKIDKNMAKVDQDLKLTKIWPKLTKILKGKLTFAYHLKLSPFAK